MEPTRFHPRTSITEARVSSNLCDRENQNQVGENRALPQIFNPANILHLLESIQAFFKVTDSAPLALFGLIQKHRRVYRNWNLCAALSSQVVPRLLPAEVALEPDVKCLRLSTSVAHSFFVLLPAYLIHG